ncbi:MULTISPECIES: phage major tail tube protein [unclassified Serratia (in: enterobacteria)]|uniref:phage major tail tube protein n=1 Tax=unclassified Serratia (in: enterobacteria) TaxID=2647522 RepID=UPI0030765D3A
MGLPRKLKLFNYYLNGNSYLGQVEEVTLPKFTVKTEDYQGGGMIGSVAVDLGFEAGALDMEVTMGGITFELMSQYGIPNADGMQSRFAGSYQAEDSGDAIPVEIQTRGRFVEIDTGNAKQGENTQHKYSLKNTYCKLTHNGAVLFELDIINMVYIVNGVDRMAQHRANVGL